MALSNSLLTLHYRSWYKDTASPALKDIVLVFDKSRAMQEYLLKEGEMTQVLNTVINTLSPKDRVTISDNCSFCLTEMFPIPRDITTPDILIASMRLYSSPTALEVNLRCTPPPSGVETWLKTIELARKL